MASRPTKFKKFNVVETYMMNRFSAENRIIGCKPMGDCHIMIEYLDGLND